MRRAALLAIAMAIALLAASHAWSEWQWRQALAAECPALALERIARAQGAAPWRAGLAHELVRRALAGGDHARLAQVRGWWQAREEPLALAARLESGAANAAPAPATLEAACRQSPQDCAALRVAAARWQLRVAADAEAAAGALGWSLPDCATGAACALPEPAIVEESLRLAWGFRSARAHVHAWLERAATGLQGPALASWRMRVALDRNQLEAAEALLPALAESCATPARAAEAALLEASLRLRQERYDQARAAIERAGSQQQAAGDPRGRARLLPYRAYLAMRQGRWESAADAFGELAEAGGDAWERRDGLAGLGNVRLHQGRAAEAAGLYRRALDLDDRLGSGDPGFRLRVLSMQAQAALQQDDPAAAEAPLVRARELALARGDRAGAVVAWLASADFQHRRGQPRAALEAIDAALALERTGEAERVSPFLSTQFEQALQRAHRLAQDGDPELRAQAVETLWALHWSMRRRPQRQLAGSAPLAPADTPVHAVQARLGDATQVLSYGYAGEQAFVLWMSKAGLRLVELPAPRAEIEEAAARWLAQLRAAQRGETVAEPDALPDLLADALVEPLWQAGMPRHGRLLLNPAGALASLPWAALASQQAGASRYLVEWHELKLVPALDWLLAPGPAGGGAALVVAAADAPPQAQAEAQWVAAHLQVLPLDAPSEAELRSRLDAAGWLHFSGHGVRNSTHPLDAHLQLGAADAQDDGRWRVAEVLGQRLRASVVVLGACEASEAVHAQDWTWFAALDMATAFVLAGAGEVVSSTLPAGDGETADLMRAYYRALATGRDSSAALAQAQRELARTLGPEHWAGFRVSGLGRLQPDRAP